MRRTASGHEPHIDWSIDVGVAAVPLQVDNDYLVTLGKRGKHRPNIRTSRARHVAGSATARRRESRRKG